VPASIAPAGVVVNVSVSAAAVRELDVYLGTRKVCTLTRAPFTCKVAPTGADVGRQSLRVVVTDVNGASAETSRNVVVLQFKARGLQLSTSRKGRRVTVTGKLKLPKQVSMLDGCKSGSVSLLVKRGNHVLDDSQVRLSRTCTFKKRVTAARSSRKLSVSARFSGNKAIAAVQANRRFS
jgi:hypothetical protein